MTVKKDFEDDFKELGKDIESIDDTLEEKYHQEKENLKERWGHLNARRKNVSDMDDDLWEDFKDEMEEGMSDLRGSYSDLKRRMGYEEEE